MDVSTLQTCGRVIRRTNRRNFRLDSSGYTLKYEYLFVPVIWKYEHNDLLSQGTPPITTEGAIQFLRNAAMSSIAPHTQK